MGCLLCWCCIATDNNVIKTCNTYVTMVDVLASIQHSIHYLSIRYSIDCIGPGGSYLTISVSCTHCLCSEWIPSIELSGMIILFQFYCFHIQYHRTISKPRVRLAVPNATEPPCTSGFHFRAKS